MESYPVVTGEKSQVVKLSAQLKASADATWMDPEGILRSEGSQHRHKCRPVSLIHTIYKNKTNEQTKAKTNSWKQRPKEWPPEESGVGGWDKRCQDCSPSHCGKFARHQMVARIEGVITLQGINMSQHYTAHLKQYNKYKSIPTILR